MINWSEIWIQAFGQPEKSGVWFIWGLSGNGKTSFCMQLLHELAQDGLCFYLSLEEGTRMTMQMNIKRFNIDKVAKNVLIGAESIEELKMRLRKKRSPQYIFIDSFQFTMMSYADYIELKAEFPTKLFIIISHAEGKHPAGRPAKSVKYDADLKLHIEGYRATSLGRTNPGGYFNIWEERANQYWGAKEI